MGWCAAGGAALAFAAALLVPAPAAAVSATGCSGSATSFDKDGARIQEVTAPGTGGTRSDPFLVDPDGSVAWSGTTAQVIRDGRWTVDAWPLSVSGRITNASGLTTKSGTDQVDDRLPLKLPGLYAVQVSLTGGDGASCTASGWVKVTGSPTLTPAWIGGSVAMVAGAGGWLSLLRRLLRGRRAMNGIGAV